ncbi:hypothetical protein PTNB73_01670 [Pyrenophora teres f. teres]|nr:hypothetical protein PTNB85_01672 [Pyrenophora teres f. teres]KAE8854012.1 hypothetical protein HRS9122_01004 [Pyrenophora teres f. teres]KAE8867756.1 hypothetical protein PTNB29_01667 [Pyrenophora teres f. teres]KAE8872519.1 hypothetical protein PTNB73_01670 [Pyrenophora teres f. teres]
MSNFTTYLLTLRPPQRPRAALQSAATLLTGNVGPQVDVIQRLYTELHKAAGSLDATAPKKKEVQDLILAATALMQAANQLTARANAYAERLGELEGVLDEGVGEKGEGESEDKVV